MTDEAARTRIERYESKLDVHGPEMAFNEDGVDLSLIRKNLERTPLERLVHADECALEIEQIRRQNGFSR